MAFWINDNRIVISVLFAIGGVLFIFLFLDSHYKQLIEYKKNHLKAKK